MSGKPFASLAEELNFIVIDAFAVRPEDPAVRGPAANAWVSPAELVKSSAVVAAVSIRRLMPADGNETANPPVIGRR
ncbi:MAG TPA: hypothetical protein VGL05_10770 [Kribbella sp.]